MSREKRLDAMVDALRRVEPVLDDVTRARVGADLQAELRAPPRPAAPAIRRRSPARWAPLTGAAAGVAAAAALVVWARGATRELPPPSPIAAAPALPSGRTVEIATGETARVAIGQADITVYGPGRVASRAADDGPPGVAPDATVDADAVLVDRTSGQGPWSVRYGDVVVRATHATFALDRTLEPRVTVMRGGLLLVCGSDEREVHAGQTATCTSTTSTAAATEPPHPPPTPGPPVRPRPAAAAAPEPPPPPPPDVAPPALAATPAEIYALADEAMRRGDRAAARAALAALIDAHPGDTDAAAALLDLARLDAADGELAAALARLDALAAHPHGGKLAEPSARLLARLATQHAAADCAAAAPLLAAYLERFPAGADAAAVSGWRDRCSRSR